MVVADGALILRHQLDPLRILTQITNNENNNEYNNKKKTNLSIYSK
jgi:hypothetical protein